MKTGFLICLLAISPQLSALSCDTLDSDRLLDAIAQVETGGVPRLGKAGETGLHQLGKDARRDHGDAATHLAWLRRELRRAGAADNAFNLALCWNAGLTRVLQGRAPMASYDYARRVENLYASSSEQRVAGSEQASALNFQLSFQP